MGALLCFLKFVWTTTRRNISYPHQITESKPIQNYFETLQLLVLVKPVSQKAYLVHTTVPTLQRPNVNKRSVFAYAVVLNLPVTLAHGTVQFTVKRKISAGKILVNLVIRYKFAKQNLSCYSQEFFMSLLDCINTNQLFF